MTEEINHAYDGGLYAELIHNRAFLDNAQTPVRWSVVQPVGSAATMTLDRNQPLNQTIPVSLRLDVTQVGAGSDAGVANEGFWGIPTSTDGTTVYASSRVNGVTTDWKRHELTLETGTVPATANARYTLTVNAPGRSG